MGGVMGGTTSVAQRKATLRRLVLARRAALGPAERIAAAGAVADALLALPEVRAAPVVLGFVPFGTEIPLEPALERVLASGKRLLVPYVDGERLRAAAVASLEELAPGFRGIREPVRRTPVDPGEAGVVLVPGVAFDATGRRLGYGGGFYDAFLAALGRGAPRVGVCFDVQVVEEVPAGPGDERVDVVVTERRVIRPPSP
jgi:5-formyltetrahydrofolate cyclo-ligase